VRVLHITPYFAPAFAYGGPPRSILGPGERLEFRSQIPAPPAEASDVMVRFLSASDVETK